MNKKFFLLVSAWLMTFCFVVNAQEEADYTVPSWTLYQRALKAGTSESEAAMLLVSKNYPYNVNVVINGNPANQFGVTWFTNTGVTGGKIQLLQGVASNAGDFNSAEVLTIDAATSAVDDLDYVAPAPSHNNDGLKEATGFESGEKRSYTSNKALLANLEANTVYSYRVGGVNGAWSAIGTFTTAKNNKDEFEFIYITDTQANTDEMFDVSKITVEAAASLVPDAKFLLCAGDFVETYHIPGYEANGYAGSAEWEWEQWFEKMQDVCFRLPIVPVQGNHDISPRSNWFNHFNTNTAYNASQTNPEARTNMDGTVYSFVYGDALFMVINFENIPLPYTANEANTTYINAIAEWLRQQAAAHPDVKWKIAVYHKSMFTGSRSHQDDGDGRFVRENIAPVLQEIGVDFALQGHDHIYEVIGVLNVSKDESNNITYTHLSDAVSNQIKNEPEIGSRESMTGVYGGTFNVQNGVLYFLNNSSGQKKYEPRTEAQMTTALSAHGVTDYYKFFNRFGQTGEPTFSRVKVSSDTIFVETYTVNKNTAAVSLFDAFKIVKNNIISSNPQTLSPPDRLTVYPNPASLSCRIETPEKIENVQIISISGQEILSQGNTNTLDLSNINNGIYIIRVKTSKGVYTEQLAVKK